MRFNLPKSRLSGSGSRCPQGLAAAVLLLVSGLAFGQAVTGPEVHLTAVATTITLPDVSSVPMWGYQCGATDTACRRLNPGANGWSPVVITAAAGQSMAIDLTNNLSFAGNAVPTSLVIVGQLGGGLGTTATSTPSPSHAQMGVTWATPNASGGTNPTFVPPPQGARVQSFATEVAAGTTARLIWNNLRAGTYLIESGTHPSIQGPMGLYGILVVTTPPAGSTAGIAYGTAGTANAVTYNTEITLLLSEIDPVQNTAAQVAVSTAGFKETATHAVTDFVSAVTVTSAGSKYTSAPTVSFVGGGGSGATAVATIDTVLTSPTFGQVTGITVTNAGTGYASSPAVVLAGGGGSGASATALMGLGENSVALCTGGAAACYPPAVNYTPLYYLINGVAFNKANASASLFSAAPATASGNLLVRLVNAGLRMHVPSLVGSTAPCAAGSRCPGGFALIAE